MTSMPVSARFRLPNASLLVALLLPISLASPSSSLAAEVEIDGEASILAAVTRKEGIAARLAHDHLIVAEASAAKLTFDPENPLASTFELRVESEALEVDSPELQARWYPTLEALGLLESPFADLSEKDRRKIRKAMLGKDQLAAAEYPQLGVRLENLVAEASTVGGEELTHRGTLVLEARGKTVRRPVSARFSLEGRRLKIDAVATFSFTELGIEPYSALLGAIKVADELYLFTHLEGMLPEPVTGESPTAP